MRRTLRKGHTTYLLLIFLPFLTACSLKLDLGEFLGQDESEELIKSEGAQDIALKIGEGIGRELVEGPPVLVENVGKGFAAKIMEPGQLEVITDSVSRRLIEESGINHLNQGEYWEAEQAFKRIGSFTRLEELALLLFDRGLTESGADVHQYLFERGWVLSPPYLTAHRMELEGLPKIETPFLREVKPDEYNKGYTRQNVGILDTIYDLEGYAKDHLISRHEMADRLRSSSVIVLADSYFVREQHDNFLTILEGVSTPKTVLGMEAQVLSLAEGDAPERLGYGRLIEFARARELELLSIGMPLGGEKPDAVNFYAWDQGIVEKVGEVLGRGKQAVLIVGDTHASIGHLPFLIETVLGVKPSVVSQTPPSLDLRALLKGSEGTGETLKELALDGDNALVVGNHYFLYTEITAAELKAYLKLFNLEGAFKAEG